jgi:rRNA-processing protein FCF1
MGLFFILNTNLEVNFNMKKKVIVDTNVLLDSSNKNFHDLMKIKSGTYKGKYPKIIGDFKFYDDTDFDIVLPQIVVEELDSKKQEYERNVGYE